MQRIAAFVRLARLKFLVGGFIGAALGTAVAGYERHRIDVVAYLLAQATITAAHLMTQFANDYFDRESDALTTRTAFSGGSGALVDGSLSPRVAIVAARACGSLCMVAALALATRGAWLAAALGIACLVFAWAYSAPPLRLLARGLGECDTALVVAMLVPLCAYAAQTDVVDLRALAATFPGAVAMFAMMICVEVPDVRADAATGKRNLVVRFGTRAAAGSGIVALALVPAGALAAMACGAPATFAVAEIVATAISLIAIVALARLRRGEPISNQSLAARGVYAFVAIACCGAIGFGSAIRFR